jgi:hypothetical protein
MRFAVLSLFMLLMPRTALALGVGLDAMTGLNLATAFHQPPDLWVPDKQEGLSTDFRAGYALAGRSGPRLRR